VRAMRRGDEGVYERYARDNHPERERERERDGKEEKEQSGQVSRVLLERGIRPRRPIIKC